MKNSLIFEFLIDIFYYLDLVSFIISRILFKKVSLCFISVLPFIIFVLYFVLLFHMCYCYWLKTFIMSKSYVFKIVLFVIITFFLSILYYISIFLIVDVLFCIKYNKLYMKTPHPITTIKYSIIYLFYIDYSYLKPFIKKLDLKHILYYLYCPRIPNRTKRFHEYCVYLLPSFCKRKQKLLILGHSFIKIFSSIFCVLLFCLLIIMPAEVKDMLVYQVLYEILYCMSSFLHG